MLLLKRVTWPRTIILGPKLPTRSQSKKSWWRLWERKPVWAKAPNPPWLIKIKTFSIRSRVKTWRELSKWGISSAIRDTFSMRNWIQNIKRIGSSYPNSPHETQCLQRRSHSLALQREFMGPLATLVMPLEWKEFWKTRLQLMTLRLTQLRSTRKLWCKTGWAVSLTDSNKAKISQRFSRPRSTPRSVWMLPLSLRKIMAQAQRLKSFPTPKLSQPSLSTTWSQRRSFSPTERISRLPSLTKLNWKILRDSMLGWNRPRTSNTNSICWTSTLLGRSCCLTSTADWWWSGRASRAPSALSSRLLRSNLG